MVVMNPMVESGNDAAGRFWNSFSGLIHET